MLALCVFFTHRCWHCRNKIGMEVEGRNFCVAIEVDWFAMDETCDLQWEDMSTLGRAGDIIGSIISDSQHDKDNQIGWQLAFANSFSWRSTVNYVRLQEGTGGRLRRSMTIKYIVESRRWPIRRLSRGSDEKLIPYVSSVLVTV
ncbi:hypothetical protein KSP39_PZI021550 [Platanthera zijinensis]|uniref:Uncharacterized protein n=1 Tax=Platanthera zijinensis TaxID=2320716 RepID=A0AAP0FVS9_9ASPA